MGHHALRRERPRRRHCRGIRAAPAQPAPPPNVVTPIGAVTCPACRRRASAGVSGREHRVRVRSPRRASASLLGRRSPSPNTLLGGPYRSAEPYERPCRERDVPVLRPTVPADGAPLSALRRAARERPVPALLLAQAPGAFACVRCGHALELEPLLDATDAPCPRCRHPLEVSAAGDGDGRPASVRVAAALRPVAMRSRNPVQRGDWRRLARWTGASARAERARRGALRAVPALHSVMNRVNFGKVSGRHRGRVQDARNVVRRGRADPLVAFAAAGGLERTRERERLDQRDARPRSPEVHAALALDEDERRLERWAEFLRAIFLG